MSVPRELAAAALASALRAAAEARALDPVGEALRTVSGELRSAVLASGSVATPEEVEAALAPLRRLADVYSAELSERVRREIAPVRREDAFARLAPLTTAARGYAETGSEERALAYLRARLDARRGS